MALATQEREAQRQKLARDLTRAAFAVLFVALLLAIYLATSKRDRHVALAEVGEGAMCNEAWSAARPRDGAVDLPLCGAGLVCLDGRCRQISPPPPPPRPTPSPSPAQAKPRKISRPAPSPSPPPVIENAPSPTPSPSPPPIVDLLGDPAHVASRFPGGGIHTEPSLISGRPIGLDVGADGLPPWTTLRVFERSEDKVWLRVSVVVKGQRFEGWMHRNVVTFPPVLAMDDLRFEDHADGLGWSDRCYVHLKAFRLGHAKAACNKGLASNPSLRWKGALLYNLGLIAEAEGDVCEAWSFHLKALAVLPKNKDVLNAIDRCRNDIFGSRCPQASTDNAP